jgi:TetR/AcrR family fatty acid metabolism transcriptional regulator
MRTREGNKEEAILRAATEVFAKHGYHEAKMSEIAEVAGIATGSAYLYFRNKESILHRIFENLWGNLHRQLAEVAARDDLDPVEQLEAMIDLLLDVFAGNPQLSSVIVNEMNRLENSGKGSFLALYEKSFDLAEHVVTEGIKRGLFNPNLDIKVFRYFFLGGLRHLVHQWANDSQSLSLNQIRQGVKSLIKRGIIVPETRMGLGDRSDK